MDVEVGATPVGVAAGLGLIHHSWEMLDPKLFLNQPFQHLEEEAGFGEGITTCSISGFCTTNIRRNMPESTTMGLDIQVRIQKIHFQVALEMIQAWSILIPFFVLAQIFLTNYLGATTRVVSILV